ncbi:hypothetical protein ACI7MO_09840 [Bacillus paranthracis]|uniref:hypothetical protein n=1 Tax=Bacillus paranthracis TaxID=2026186 RepID=UPI0039788737
MYTKAKIETEHKIAKSQKEMLDKLLELDPEECFAVTYDSFQDEYKIWCGNHPYGFYENEIARRDDEIIKLRKEVNRQNEIIDCFLETSKENKPKKS